MAEPQRAWLIGRQLDGSFRGCAIPCQASAEDGQQIRRSCSVPIGPRPGRVRCYEAEGPAEVVTISPAIICQDCGWTGLVREGRVHRLEAGQMRRHS